LRLLPGLAAVGGILVAASAAGWSALSALRLVRAGVAERLAWSFALGLMLLAGIVPVGLAAGFRPGWVLDFLAACALALLARAVSVRAPSGGGPSSVPRIDAPAPGLRLVLAIVIAAGSFVYLLRALTEPMWATDFLAIWGWKGKTIFEAGGLPPWTYRMPELGFTHPEYPLGLPLLYASLAFLLRAWDDHATALLFPACQAATLLLLFGWLRRRGVSSRLALAAAAALSLFEPLYRAFTTGMAEVPLSFFLLLLGASLADALDGEPGGVRRLAVAACGAAALKNEGLLAAAAAAGIALLSAGTPRRLRLRAAAASLSPALLVFLLHRIVTGPLPLRDFDFRLLGSREFPIRLAFDARAIALELGLLPALGVAAFAALLAAGRRSAASDRMLALAGILLATYALMPALCVLGPDWLVRTAFFRTSSALAPLAAAAAALRLAPVFGESARVDLPATDRPSETA